MAATAVGLIGETRKIRYNDHGALDWLLTKAPCNWNARIDIEFRDVPLNRLQQASSPRNPKTIEDYRNKIALGRALSPLVVSETGNGTYYVHDGNHRIDAFRFGSLGAADIPVRVAVIVPRPGYRFQWRWFRDHGTYLLEPQALCCYRREKRRPRYQPSIEPLLGRTLVLVAHPDDEVGGCAALLQRMRDPIVVFATDGAPNHPFFWSKYGSRQVYGEIRRREARRNLFALGIRHVHFLDEFCETRFGDQQLYNQLPFALAALMTPICLHRPAALLVPAYEGGHPDHDACSFIGSLAGELSLLPVWEMPLYHRTVADKLECQRFVELNGTEKKIILTTTEITNRSVMIAGYSSQLDLGNFIRSKVEWFRPQPRYDYSKPPHEGAVNYERWGWPISARQVCDKLQECLAEFRCTTAQGDGAPRPTHVDTYLLPENRQIHGPQA